MKTPKQFLAIAVALALCLSTIPVLADTTETGTEAVTTPVIEPPAEPVAEPTAEAENEAMDEETVNTVIDLVITNTEMVTEDLTAEDATEVETTITVIEEDIDDLETQLITTEKQGYDIQAKKLVVAKIKLLIVKIKKAHKDGKKAELKKLQAELKMLLKDLKVAKIKAKKERMKHHAEEHGVNIPKDCLSWFDGCNTCTVSDGALGACTLMSCDKNKPAKCLSFKDKITDENVVPKDCLSWFDGCNKCMVKDGVLGGCTKMACEKMKEAKCLKKMTTPVIDKAVDKVEETCKDGEKKEHKCLKHVKMNLAEMKKQGLLSIRWGQVRKITTEKNAEDTEENLNENADNTEENTAEEANKTDTEEKAELNTKTNWNGKVSVINGKIKLVDTILFDSQDKDKINSATDTEINFNSQIANHFDGVLLRVFPNADNSYEDVSITVSFEDQEGLTYDKTDTTKGSYKELVNENGQGVIIEKRLPNAIAEENLQNFKAEHRDDFEKLLKNINEEHQAEIQGVLENFDETEQTDFIAKHKKFGDKLNKMVKHLPYVPEAKRDDFLNKKLDILDKAENLDQVVKGLKISANKMKQAEEMLTLVEEYNFDTKTADKVNNRIDQFIKKASEAGIDTTTLEAEVEKIKTEMDALKLEAKNQKFNEGIIPFKDTDDSEWFTEYVSYVKGKNIVGGYKDNAGKDLGEFRPANNVTVAEVLKMALEASGVDTKNVTGTPKNVVAASHWAKNYFKVAEDLGLTIVKDANLDPNRLANRGEIIRLALEALKIQPEAITSIDFTDVKITDANAPYIQYAKTAGVISGDAGKNTFRPEAPITRAEIAKILKNMIEILKTSNELAE